MDTERGAIQTRFSDLASEEDSSRLRLERHRLSEELQGYGRDWAVRTIAESLIRQAQSKFEKERQPDVIRHAERFFLDVTDGAYKAMYSPLGSSEINVRDAAGNVRTPQQLSRGTREQLFLALRFGLILELGQRCRAPPGDRGRGAGELRSDQGHQGRRLIHRPIGNQPGAGLHLPPADRGMVRGGCVPTRRC